MGLLKTILGTGLILCSSWLAFFGRDWEGEARWQPILTYQVVATRQSRADEALAFPSAGEDASNLPTL